jgi:hypothetical protein
MARRVAILIFDEVEALNSEVRPNCAINAPPSFQVV